jgi:hypothetical protein
MRIIVTTLAALFITGSALAGPVASEKAADTSFRVIEAGYETCGCGHWPPPSF